MNKKNKQSFTLIELLVVIAIIGILSTVVLVSLQGVRARARDARRLSDIKQIQTALEEYYNDNGHYPISGACNASSPNGGWCNSVQSLSNGHWLRNGTSVLSFDKDPVDPTQGTSAVWTPIDGKTYFYYSNSYGGSGQWYMLIFGLENHSHELQSKDGVTACDGTYFHYGSGSDGLITLGGNCP